MQIVKHFNRGREEGLSNHPIFPAARAASQMQKWGSESRTHRKGREQGAAFPWHRGCGRAGVGELRWANSLLCSPRAGPSCRSLASGGQRAALPALAAPLPAARQQQGLCTSHW